MGEVNSYKRGEIFNLIYNKGMYFVLFLKQTIKARQKKRPKSKGDNNECVKLFL